MEKDELRKTDLEVAISPFKPENRRQKEGG